MTKLENCYVIDSLDNIGAYGAISDNFKTACDFLQKGDFSKLVPGKNVIDGDNVFVNRVEASYVAEADRPTEFHRDYFDIHVPLAADEKIGLGVYEKLPSETFDGSTDCGASDQPLPFFTVKRGEFAICWPKTCAHAPAVTTDTPKKALKLIVKVRA